MNSTDARRPVFDASAVLALLLGEPGSGQLRQLQSRALVNAVNEAEVLAKLVNGGMPLEEAQAAYEALHLDTSPFDKELSQLSARYVRKGVSLGDRCFLAAVERHGSGWTADHDLGAFVEGLAPQLNFFR